MSKEYTSLGLMSGTSGDGVDASLIISDGDTKYEVINENYFEYNHEIYKDFHNLKEKVQNIKDLLKFKIELNEIERKITLFHAKVVKAINLKHKIDLIGFHGQTIFHSPKDKISKQLGNGKLLSQLTKQKIVYNFRSNDIKNGGEGAPLTPIFHALITKQYKLDLPVCILNIGGISNITFIKQPIEKLNIISRDIGPGNCLIDKWVRKNSEKKFDKDGLIASNGNINEIILEQAQELFSNRQHQQNFSFDTDDFDPSFARGLSLEDGAATLTRFTSKIISSSLLNICMKKNSEIVKVIVCGGGRKNNTLINQIKQDVQKKLIIKNIDDYKIDGDFIESQAFAFLAIRSLLKLPISFPETTGCTKPCVGGSIVNFK